MATGTQSLKNLVLPGQLAPTAGSSLSPSLSADTLTCLPPQGIGHFEILTDRMTSPQDIGQNFFLTPDSLGKPLAEETTKYLRELNSGVTGQGKVAVSRVGL